VYDNEPYAHMTPISSVISGIESLFDEGKKVMKVKVPHQGRIEAKPSDMPNMKPNTKPNTTPNPGSADNSKLPLQKIFTNATEFSELLASILMALLVGLVSYPQVTLGPLTRKWALTQEGHVCVSHYSTIHHRFIQLYTTCGMARKRLFPGIQPGVPCSGPILQTPI
jgi:hypothetical protein